MNFKEILELIDKVADRGIASVEVERAGTKVRIEGKQSQPQYLDMESAIKHCAAGLGIWEWASTCQSDEEPDVVMACCGDVPTLEILAAVDLLREGRFPADAAVTRVVSVRCSS